MDDPCLLQERCVTGTGHRNVLRFSTVVANLGCADFEVSSMPDDPSLDPASLVGNSSSPWTWHTCHQHYHLDDYAHYSLRRICDLGPFGSPSPSQAETAWEDRPVVGHKNGWVRFATGLERAISATPVQAAVRLCCSE